MPRKKIRQPEPLESFEIDGVIVEVRDESCWEVGRGMHNNLKKEQQIGTALEIAATDYLTRLGRRKALPSSGDYMRNASEFAREMERRGLGTVDGCDDSSLRKSIYPEVKKRLKALQRAIDAKNKSHTNAQK